MISRRVIGWTVLVYTLASWGGRIGLLTEADAADLTSWIRIVGSLVVGLAAAIALIWGRRVRPMAVVFAVFTTFIWVRSLISVWTTPNSLGFQLVHSVLAALWFVLVVLTLRAAQATRSGVGEAVTGVPGATIPDSASTTSSIDR